jgi:DNA-binding NarL/FixJ family response regulator
MASLHVLVIDDDEDVLNAIVQDCSDAGFDFATAGSLATGKAALLSGGPFAAVILDLQLGDGDGADLLPFIGGTTKTIILSGRLNAGRTIALTDRCDLILPKPFDTSDIIAVLWRVTQGSQLENVVNGFAESVGLRPCEARILLLAVEGFPDEAMAIVCRTTENSIRIYWERIRKQTNCRSRNAVLAALLRYALDHR